MAKKFVQVLYRVWRDDLDTEEDGREYGSFSVESAAQAHAAFCHRHRSGWEWEWPVTFRVRDGRTSKVYDVEVKRDLVPEFSSSLGKPVSEPLQ